LSQNLSEILDNNNWVITSITKKSNWAKGERYQITVNKGYNYIVYLDGTNVQSINNMKNQIVYGSRANY
jgi:hypothetical protein